MKKLFSVLAIIGSSSILYAQNVWDGGANIPSVTTNGNVGIGATSTNTRLNINNTLTNHGIVQNTTNALTGTQYGISNTLSNTGTTGIKYGFYNSLSTSTTSSISYGLYNTNNISGNGTKYGFYSTVQGTGTGAGYGIYSIVSGSATTKYGVYSTATNTGTNNSSTDATSFGVYSIGTGANSRAGYFRGDLEINQGNTIYSAANGNKTLVLENYGAGDYSYTIAMNQTDNQYDWSFDRAFVLNRAGEMIKGCNNANDVFMIKRFDLSGDPAVFKVKGDGKVYATEVNVMVTPFPDYVFRNDYDLKTLAEVRNYIAENGHLPNVPSAEKVAVDGVNVGEMTKILVEKVEELTLYILQQDDRLEAQQKEIEQLKKQLEAKH